MLFLCNFYCRRYSTPSWRGKLKLINQLKPFLFSKDDANSGTKVSFRIATGFGLLLAGKFLNVQVPYIFKMLVEKLQEPPQQLDLNMLSISGTILLGYTSARIAASLSSELKNVIFSRISSTLQRKIAVYTFSHLHKLDHSFHANANPGVLAKTIDRGVKGISFLMSSMLFNVVPTVVEIGLVCGVLYWKFGIEYATVSAFTMLSYIIFTLKVTSWRTKFRRQMNSAENEASLLVNDSLAHHETVKLFRREQYETRNYESHLLDYEMASRKTFSSLALLNIGQNVIFSAALGGIMFMTSKEIISGALTVGDLVFVNGLVFQLSLPLNFLGGIYRELKQSLVDIESMTNLLNTRSKIIERSNLDLHVTEGKIIFDKVTFSIDGRRILDEVDLMIPPGKKVAIVGPSGSGKSTLVKLLLRFIDPDSGRILIDGQPIDNVTLSSLRAAIGLVPQDTSLLNRSLIENVSYSNSNVDPQKLNITLYQSKLNHLNHRMNVRVGERGALLSGGEKQRVALARVLLQSPSIMIFDEATSSLDSRTEHDILHTINSISSTCIFIAHRLTTVCEADLIVVLKDGKIFETGTHKDLLKKKSLYWELWMSYLKNQSQN